MLTLDRPPLAIVTQFGKPASMFSRILLTIEITDGESFFVPVGVSGMRPVMNRLLPPP